MAVSYINCTLLKVVVPVFLVVHVCRTVDRVVGRPRPFLSSIGARGCPRWDPPMCLDAQGDINPLWLLEVLSISRGGLPNKLNAVPLHWFCTRFVFRV